MGQNHAGSSTPLLKWPGGKRALVKHILALMPASFKRYYEPFVGGGALFFALNSDESVLADKNAELVNCYCQVRDSPQEVVSYLSELKNNRADYYAVRASRPSAAAARAARLIYLTTLSFNGIHRVNQQGEFNVPYGHKTHLVVCNPVKIYEASARLGSARLLCADFEEAVVDARAGDVIYLDPPYTVAHGNNGFLKYNARIFSWDDQVRLARVATALHRRGCHVLVSNAHHPSIEDLYSGFNMKLISRASVIAASAGSRGEVTECIFYSKE